MRPNTRLPLLLLLALPVVATAESDPAAPFTIAAGDRWAPIEQPTNAIQPGGVFDFAFLNDAPAGKHGPIRINADGHFEFANRPGQRVRFWGVNLVSSACFLDRETADRVAERLARSGYNTVRLHHFDRALALRDPITRKLAPSGQLDPEKLEQLDYLFAALKKRGLYINIDLYSLRLFNAEEMIAFGLPPEAAEGLSGGEAARIFKTAIRFSEPAFEAWAAFSRALLTHRNPHTGLTWAEDPALVGICPVNEDVDGARIERNPVFGHIFERGFTAWLDRDDNRAAYGARGRDAAYERFLYEIHAATDARLYSFLKDELGVRVPLSGANHMRAQRLVFNRASYDYVDGHQYWDHPRFLPGNRFKLPFDFHQKSPVAGFALSPCALGTTRILGKPFTVTEFNFVRPNRYRAEGGVLMPAYASLQDWDGLYNFEYASTAKTLAPEGDVTGGFSLASDPVGLLADRVSALLFLRGDIRPGKGEIAFVAEPDTAFRSRLRPFGEQFPRLGLVARIGAQTGDPAAVAKRPGVSAVVVDPDSPSASPSTGVYPADDELPAKLLADGRLPAGSIEDGNLYRSDTGQITLDAAAGTARFVTARSEGFSLSARASLAGDFATARNVDDTPGTVTVVSVDGRPLAVSRRILVLHLADALPSGMTFASADRTRLVDRGGPPLLVERAAADIDLNFPADARLRAWAVDMDGARLESVALEKTGQGWRLRADTLAGAKPRFAYEIVRESR